LFKDEFAALTRRIPVEAQTFGLLTPERIVECLASSDVLLFVRGTISSRRGSAIAGIACGLPVIAMAGSETAAPITDAGVVLLPDSASYGDLERQWSAFLRIANIARGWRTAAVARRKGIFVGKQSPRATRTFLKNPCEDAVAFVQRQSASIKVSFFCSASSVKASNEDR
jgi:hypothetical protein